MRNSQNLQRRLADARSELLTELRKCRVELEQSIWARVSAIPDSHEGADPEHRSGLRRTVSTGVDFAFSVIDHGDVSGPQVPADLLVRARLAAQVGVSLDTVLRRYASGYSLFEMALGRVLIETGSISGEEQAELSRARAAAFDRVMDEVCREYRQGVQLPRGASAHLSRSVASILDGSDPSGFGIEYGFDGHHFGLVVRGPGSSAAVRDIATSLDCRPLFAERDPETLWAWLGCRHALESRVVENAFRERWPTHLRVGVGERLKDLHGWRLSHRQANAAFPFSDTALPQISFYGEICLVASMAQDDVLVESLKALFLEPLESERDGGQVLRETLRAYFSSDRNGASAAASLRVSRQTITNRLRRVEELIGRTLPSCAAEVEAGLKLDERLISRRARA